MNRGGRVNMGADPMTADDLPARLDSTTEQWDTWDGRSADAMQWSATPARPVDVAQALADALLAKPPSWWVHPNRETSR